MVSSILDSGYIVCTQDIDALFVHAGRMLKMLSISRQSDMVTCY